MSDDFLDRLVGDWVYEGVSVPDDPAHRKTGFQANSRRGRWLVMEGEDYRFQLAFDEASGKVEGDFVHWGHPNLWVYDGAVEADGRLHLKSRGPSFDVEGQETDYDDVIEIVSADEHRLTGRMVGADGQWRDFMVTTLRRRA